MKYSDFELYLSKTNSDRYLHACNGDKDKAVCLFMLNSNLSCSLFQVIGLLEMILRNAIDERMSITVGPTWIEDSVKREGIFADPEKFPNVQKAIFEAFDKMKSERVFSHDILVTKMDFGFWRYMFNRHVYNASGRFIMKIFINKDIRTENGKLVNQAFVFEDLKGIHHLRNRIAHNEPICFKDSIIDTSYANIEYLKILKYFRWLGIDTKSFLLGLDNVEEVLKKINRLKQNK